MAIGDGSSAAPVLDVVKDAIRYGWVVVLSVLGGVASYMQRIEQGTMRFSLFRLIAEIVVSGFVGVIVFLLCEASGMTPVMSAVFVGIGGHMGSRALNFLEGVLMDWLKKHNFLE